MIFIFRDCSYSIDSCGTIYLIKNSHRYLLPQPYDGGEPNVKCLKEIASGKKAPVWLKDFYIEFANHVINNVMKPRHPAELY